jgi:penicillin-binding protein-related factor A (putative recombinase)
VSNNTFSLFVIVFNIDKTKKALCFYVQKFSDINHVKSVNKNKTICFKVNKSVKFNCVFIVYYNTEYSQIQAINKLT